MIMHDDISHHFYGDLTSRTGLETNILVAKRVANKVAKRVANKVAKRVVKKIASKLYFSVS